MSAERRSTSRVAAWIILAVTVPVLYLLSVPPILVKARIATGTRGEPAWVTTYCEPYHWARNRAGDTALGKWLDRYEEKCWEWLIPR